MDKIIEVLPDVKALAQRSLDLVRDKIQASIAQRGFCTLVLAGGSTPKSLYEALAFLDLPWDKIHVFWGDERYVPANHPDSNQQMARRAWLDLVDMPGVNIHPMPTSSPDPAQAAQAYEQQLIEFFQVSAGEFPTFDIILLGMGDDGHTASLFPHTDALQVRTHLITVGNKDAQPRLTFTFELINHARCVIFMVSGANKRSALTQVLAAKGDELTYPARLIQPQGELWWLLDEAAGVDFS